MKVVIFCGGLGTADATEIDSAPKPMMTIGDRPVLWHVMRYYAHFGHNEFILCLGYGAASVKEYFLNYEETSSNDFVLAQGRPGRRAAPVRHLRVAHQLRRHRHRHRDRGAAAQGPALPRGRRDLPGQLRRRADRRADGPHRRRTSSPRTPLPACWPCRRRRRSTSSTSGTDDRVSRVHAGVRPVRVGQRWILRPPAGRLRRPEPGEDLVTDAFARLADQGKLAAVRYNGFWAPMDTLKERSDAGGPAPPWRVPPGSCGRRRRW